MMKRHRQRGSALMIALFLIIVVGGLGIVAMRLGTDQRHGATLELLQLRATTAAHAGLEFWTHRAFATNGGIACPTESAPDPLYFSANDVGLDGFRVSAWCSRYQMGPDFVYEIEAEAIHGAYGQSDFVRRTLTRRVTNMDPTPFNVGRQSRY